MKEWLPEYVSNSLLKIVKLKGKDHAKLYFVPSRVPAKVQMKTTPSTAELIELKTNRACDAVTLRMGDGASELFPRFHPSARSSIVVGSPYVSLCRQQTSSVRFDPLN